jgi:hypothetical protein
MNRLTNHAAATDRVAVASSTRVPLVICQNVIAIRKMATTDLILESRSYCGLVPAARIFRISAGKREFGRPKQGGAGRCWSLAAIESRYRKST